MDTELLEEIGLTKGEAKVYLTLLETGASTTGAIIKGSGISASKVYQILDRLAKKGLVGHSIKEGSMHFQAAEPKRILNYLNEKEKEMLDKKQRIIAQLPQLELKAQAGAAKRTAEIFEGKRGALNLFNNILDDLKSGEEYFVIGAGLGFEEIPGMWEFFQKYHTERAKHGIKVNMLANHSYKDRIVPATKLLGDVKFLPEELVTNLQITFYKKKTFIVLWSKEPVAFLIHNPDIVKGFRSYFELLWNRASK